MVIRKKILKRGLLIFLGCVFLLLFFLPLIIKNYVVKNSKEFVGRQIEIGSLKYNYFTSTAQVYDFKMFEQNEKDVFTSFDTLIIDLEPIRFFYNENVIEQFYLKGLMVKMVMKDSVFNFDDLITFHTSSEDTTANNSVTAEPVKYNISNIELKDANFFFDNQTVGKETHIEDFSFIIPYVGWDQKEKSNADVKFNFKNGGYLESDLNINPVDGEFDAMITVKDLFLEPFYEYVLEYAEVNSFKGLLNSQILVKGNTNDPVKSIVSGHADVRDFVMTDANNKKILGATRVDCILKEIDYYNSHYVIDSLKLYEPYVYFEMDSVTNNMFRIFKLYPEPKETAIDSTSDTYYAINNLSVNKGILDYSDNLTGIRFDYHLSDITAESKDIISDAEWVNIYSDMLLNNRGTLNAKLGFNPSDYTNLNLDLTIENFLLSDINVYSSYYTGHNILKGDFYYYSQSKITNGNIESENKLLVKNVSVSNNKSGLYSLPLKFALFLLKDKNGDVNLEIPVRGDLNDPQVSVGKIVWNTFKNLIIKTVASPINFLAGLVDGDPKEFEELKFTYTDTIPSERQFRKLDKLLEMESKKEGLKIELTHFVDPDLQREAIAYSELGKQYFRDTEKDYLTEDTDFEMYVRTKVGNDSISIKEAVYQLLKPQTADSLANLFNKALIKNTKDYLLSIKDSTNITVIKSELKEPENKGSISRFKIKYDMLENSDEKKPNGN
jgi:hypothetical protein